MSLYRIRGIGGTNPATTVEIQHGQIIPFHGLVKAGLRRFAPVQAP